MKKYFKIFGLLFGVLSLTGCSDKEDFNTAGGVTVQMGQNELSVKENQGMINVPITLSGNANGPVVVNLKVEGTGNIPAVPYEERDGKWSGNYIVTSETINFPAGVSTVDVEISLLDDYEETGDRTFTISIASCEGATIGTVSSTLVTVIDNESLPLYDIIPGKWSMSYVDRDGQPAVGSMSITGYPEGTEEYKEGQLLIMGLCGFDDMGCYGYLVEDEATGKAYVEIDLPFGIGWYDQAHLIVACGSNTKISGYADLANDITLRAEFDKETQTITFAPEDKIWLIVTSPDFSDILGNIGTSQQMVMTRPQE